MSTPSCSWVRMRLSLEIGPNDGDLRDGDDRTPGCIASARLASHGDGVGFESRDHAKLARHLDECPGCRRHRAELIEAMSALSAVSSISPLAIGAPSLWPALELRIREREQTREQPVASRPLLSAARFRLIRCRDAVRETIDDALGGWSDFLPERGLRLSPGIAFASLLAALLGGVIVLQAVRSQSRSQLEIAQGARPLVESMTAREAARLGAEAGFSEIAAAADHGGERWLWQTSTGTVLTPPDTHEAEELHSGFPGPLAQAEVQPRARSNSATGGGNSGAVVGPASSSSKLDFDLERGTPMAPDSRDAKPAY